MTGGLFFGALAALPAFGWGLVPRRASSWMPRPAGLAVAAGLGALAIGVEMLAMSALGIRWTAVRIAAGPLLLTALRLARRGRDAGLGWPRAGLLGSAALAASLAVIAYAAFTTRATAADLLLFWGAKAERFAIAGGIDVAFLRDRNHWGVHSDYPPLLSCVWAFASLVAGRFAWGASLGTLPLFSGLLVLAAWGLARLEQDERGAAASAALLGALLCATLPIAATAGNADPVLLFFEGTALLLLVFARERPGATPIAGALVAAAVLTKFEGGFFAAALVAASLLTGRERRNRWREAAILAAFPAAALAGWLAFCRSRALFDFLGHAPRLYVDAGRLAVVVRGLAAGADYGAAWAPWIVAAALLLLARPSRGLGLALGAAAFTAAADVLIYLTSPADPTMWVAWSASRLLLTPLTCLFVAAIASRGVGAGARSRSRDDRTQSAASAAPAG